MGLNLGGGNGGEDMLCAAVDTRGGSLVVAAREADCKTRDNFTPPITPRLLEF